MIPVTPYADKTVAVFGLGVSGLATAKALAAGGATAIVWDDGEGARKKAAEAGFEPTPPADWPWDKLAALVLSPGVPLTHPKPHPVVKKAHTENVRVIGDIELLAETVNAAPAAERPKIVAITGTNGKSTTTALIGHILNACGVTAHIGGNIGEAMLNLPKPRRGAVYVLELSSYQLDLAHSLKADIAVWLNISPDHLDRHGGIDGYVAAKKRIFRNQTHDDVCVIGVDDDRSQSVCTEVVAANGRRVIPVSSGAALGRGVFAVDGVLFSSLDYKAQEVGDLTDAPALQGAHNWQNAAAAFAVAHTFVSQADDVLAAMMTFPGLPHRMEEVRRIGNVKFINDSKATNIEAASKALAAYRNIYWIAGGKAKDGDDPAALGLLTPRIAKAYFIGEAAGAFAEAFENVPQEKSGDLSRAVAAAAQDALAAGSEAVVLLSPACASFDQFTNFTVRGDAFRDAVLAIGSEANGAGGAAA